MKIHILVVGLNNIEYTKGLVEDLQRQTHPYKLTLVDQGSTEEGAQEYLHSLEGTENLRLVFNGKNVPLNRLWDKFPEETTEPYLCFLNNDMRVPKNYVADTVQILDKEPAVGCVVHTTNDYTRIKLTALDYDIPKERFIQGWDFTLRRELYVKIPDCLLFWGGDDILFRNLYDEGWKVAVANSSPIMHFRGKTLKGCGTRIRNRDCITYQKLGLGKDRLPYGSKNSTVHPGRKFCRLYMKYCIHEDA